MKILSIVVARAGSKGLHNKHLLKIDGKAVFEYPIEYSLNLQNKILDDITTVVSSDSIEIEEYCKKHDIIFLKRKTGLATDNTNIEDVIYDVYSELESNYDLISLVACDVPIRYSRLFEEAYYFLMAHNDYDGVISMQETERFNPSWMFKFNEDLLPISELDSHQRQGLNSYMLHDGHTLLFHSDYFLKKMKEGDKTKRMYGVFGETIKPLINTKPIIQLDTEIDFRFAKSFIEHKQ